MLSHRPHFQYPITFDLTSGSPVLTGGASDEPVRIRHFLYRCLEEAITTKRAMILYLGHLTPLLARLSRVNGDLLRFLQRTNLEVTEHRIVQNIKILQALIARMPDLGAEGTSDFLQNLLVAVRPEIDEFALRELDRSPQAARYLLSIREAERKLALHFNAAVLLLQETSNPALFQAD